MELGTALTPVAPLPLSEARDHVPLVVGGVLESDGDLPADIRFPVEWAFAGSHRRDMQ